MQSGAIVVAPTRFLGLLLWGVFCTGGFSCGVSCACSNLLNDKQRHRPPNSYRVPTVNYSKRHPTLEGLGFKCGEFWIFGCLEIWSFEWRVENDRRQEYTRIAQAHDSLARSYHQPSWCLTYPSRGAPWHRPLRSLVLKETWALGLVTPRMHARTQTLWIVFAH